MVVVAVGLLEVVEGLVPLLVEPPLPELEAFPPDPLDPPLEPPELPRMKRQALHASRLAFDHPLTGKRVSYTAPLPSDMANALKALRKIAAG